MLAGCSSTRPWVTNSQMPEDLMQECDDLPELTGNTGGIIIPWAISVVNQYNDCKAIQAGLVNIINI